MSLSLGFGQFDRQLAAQEAQPANSLSIIPADASFYFSSMNQRKKFDAVANSRAWLELEATPLFQSLEEQLVNGFVEGFADGSSGMDAAEIEAGLRDMIGDGQFEDLQALLIDMVSQEAFVYGGPGFMELMELNRGLDEALSEQLEAMPDTSAEAIQKKYFETWDQYVEENLDQVEIPDLVLGLTLKDPELASKHIELLHAFVTLAMVGGEVPREIRRGYRKRDIGDGKFVSLKLRGDLLPWDSLLEGIKEADSPELEKRVRVFVEHAREMTIELGVGVYDDFLLLSIGDSLEHIEMIANSEKLIDCDFAQTLREQESQDLSSVCYVSDRLAKATHLDSFEKQINSLLQFENVVPTEAEIDFDPEPLLKLARLLDRVKLPAGGSLNFGKLTDEGIEGYRVWQAVDPGLDGSKPLTLLNKLDEDPLFWSACRRSDGQKQYETLSDAFDLLLWFVNESGIPEEGDELTEALQRFSSAVEKVRPDVDAAMRNHMLPATKDGQAMFVLDSKTARKQWSPTMQASAEPLPVPEFAFLTGVNDREEFMVAMGVFDQAVRDIMIDLEAPDELALPEAIGAPRHDGELIWYPITDLEVIGLDAALMPSLGLDDHCAVFGLNMQITDRLMKQTEFRWPEAFAVHQQQSLAAACEFNHEAAVAAIEAWYRYGVQLGGLDELADSNDLQLSREEIEDSFDTLLRIARCFQGYRSVTTIDEGTTKTHYQWRFQDLPW